MIHERKIVAIVDEDGEFEPQYYDITNMKGELKDYYSKDENGNLVFNSFDEYEEDMLERGAVPIKIIKHFV